VLRVLHVLQCVAIGRDTVGGEQVSRFCSVLPVLQCVTTCCSVRQWALALLVANRSHVVAVCCVCCSDLRRVAVCCSVLQCVAVCCSVLQLCGNGSQPLLAQ